MVDGAGFTGAAAALVRPVFGDAVVGKGVLELKGPMTTLSKAIWVEKTATTASSFGPSISLPSAYDAVR